MKAFIQACGCDFDHQPNMRRVEDYIRKGAKFTYLKRSPYWKNYYYPLVVKWMKSRAIRGS